MEATTGWDRHWAGEGPACSGDSAWSLPLSLCCRTTHLPRQAIRGFLVLVLPFYDLLTVQYNIHWHWYSRVLARVSCEGYGIPGAKDEVVQVRCCLV